MRRITRELPEAITVRFDQARHLPTMLPDPHLDLSSCCRLRRGREMASADTPRREDGVRTTTHNIAELSTVMPTSTAAIV
jgi:hypothetical protein